MAKSGQKILVLSILCFFLVSCHISPTYSRKDISKAIKKICQEEFSLNVGVWDVGDTVWVYAPLKLLREDGQWNMNEDNTWNEEVTKDIRNISSSLTRVFLSIDRPPKFYCLVISNIEGVGIDWYNIVFVPDELKYTMEQYSIGYVSSYEMLTRRVSLPVENPEALGDTEGKHISRYDISMGEFVSYLVRQSLERIFSFGEFKDNFKVNSLKTYYYRGKLGVIFDIVIEKYIEDLPNPFEEAKQTIKKFLTTYGSLLDVVEIEIVDTLNDKSSIFSRKALLASD